MAYKGQVAFQVTDEQRKILHMAASLGGVSLSSFARRVLLREANAVISEARKVREDMKAINDDRQAV